MIPSTPSAQSPPPGWYPVDGGPMRWWDGSAWGPWAPVGAGPHEPVRSEFERGRATAVISHLGFIGGSFILPLVLYLVEKDKPNRNRYVCHHACEALNWSITFMIVWLGSFAVLFLGTFASVAVSGGDTFPWPFAVAFPAMFVFMALNWVFGILAMVRANQGVWWRYPINIRLVGRGVDWQQA